MTTAEWIAEVNRLREADGWLVEAEQDSGLARGNWHGYTNGKGPPLRGRYVLVRWKAPTVAVSHDDPSEVLSLASLIEAAIPS